MRYHALSALALLIAAAPSTAPAQSRRERDRDRDRETQRDAFTWSQRLARGRWIRVRNLSGRITVTSTTSDRVEVTGTKSWKRSNPESVRFEVQRYGSNGENVVICALWEEGRTSCDERGYEAHNVRNNDVSVDFRIALPRGVNVGVSTINGEVDVDGATGEVEASTVNGDVGAVSSGGPVRASTVNGSVTARMGRFDSDEDLIFSTVNGSVLAEFDGDLDADIELSTVNGGFHSDYPVTVRGRLDPHHLRARLGRGGRQVKLTTVNGNVELRRRGG
jgi:hypothetical protein